ncbi:hypothetical protein BN7_903 [Wickerhamomyces ciferrii]|uniref:DNA-binding protein REB1 n=1 Tax=Wickerhamomyces ciferrii (strain ATCC 14091 / BCRC 22168 / CBS 111 / JCM 3599 / NBRC 0793 / NRRL Y-1031 F-60-10) TaxID=1206466 RepID=K0KIV8_WICCF|nr:uncharacterized protein BN7_903 [Wickerhamomyces ciferrii]CCH41364.1 hypothetical protein BN7_903 [Wickerhamomyces ciferrii]
MSSRDYHEGAKALLDLKKKDDVKKEGELNAVDDNIIGDDQDDAIGVVDHDNESVNNKDDNNVEAAVMRFVGGTLDNRKSNKRKKSFPTNDEINEFQHWNAFLETDQLQQSDDFGPEPTKDQQQQQPQPIQPSPAQSRSRKRKKVDQHQHQQAPPNLNVDPELAQLDDTTEHEQLVRAAILDANQLAQDVNVNIQDYIQHPNDDPENKYTQLSQQALDTNIIQAAQVAAAAAAAQEQHQSPQPHHQTQPQQQQSQDQAQPQGHESTQLVSHQAQQEHRIQEQNQSQQHDHHDQSQQQVNTQNNGLSQQTSQHQSSIPSTQQQNIQNIQNTTPPPSTHSNSEAAALVAAAAQKASNWIQTQQQGKMFSKEEIEAIDKFIVDYCTINNMTRNDICQRVWSNERKKDDFWESLHKVLPYRTRASVYKHVRRSYHIFEVRGKWTPEEDKVLGRLAQERDGQWKLIGQEMGRMPEDCRDRWRNYVKCGNNRAQNKWSESEENKLKTVISEIFTEQNDSPAPIINWTLVSEKMGGTRSRIQCRYKWNKILKRDALARAQTIDINDRVWLLTKLQELRFLPESEIDWDALATIHPKNIWTGHDFKICYEKMRSSIRDFKKKTVLEITVILLQDLVQDANRNNVELELPVGLQQLADQHQHQQQQHNQSQSSQSQPSQEQPLQAKQEQHETQQVPNDPNDLTDPEKSNEPEDPTTRDETTNLANAAVNAVAEHGNNETNEDEAFNMWRTSS